MATEEKALGALVMGTPGGDPLNRVSFRAPSIDEENSWHKQGARGL